MFLEIDDAQRPEQIVRKLRQRRRREFGTVLLLAASIFLLYEGFNHPEIRMAGLSGKGLLLAAAVLMAASLGYHLANWRCPACNRYLRGGYRPAFCQPCGALFQGSGGVADEKMYEEQLFEEKVKEYRTPYAFHLLRGMAVFVVSLVGLLGSRTGGNFRSTALIGFFVLIGLVWMAYAVYGMTYRARRFAARLREHLDA